MLLLVLAGSASFAVRRHRTKSASICSSLVMKRLSSQIQLTTRNGSFVQHVNRPIIYPVSPPALSNRLKPRDGHSSAHSMNAKVNQSKQVTPPTNQGRSTNRVIKRVIKRVTLTRLVSLNRTMVKQKFSKKGKGGKLLKAPEEKKLASSHKGQRNQQWKEEKMLEAEELWELNKTLPPEKQLSMRAIAKKVEIGKTTVIERLSGRRKGKGHIAGGKRKARVLTEGKQVGQ